MVRRRGIGATLATSVVFSVILISGLSVYVASQDFAGLSARAYSENYLQDEYIVLAGAGATDVLASMQAYVSSSPISCESPASVVSAHAAGLTDRQGASGLTVVTTATLGQGSKADNLSVIGGFAGSEPGELDLALKFTGWGGSGQDVTFNRTEVHEAHLPVRLAEASSLCLSYARSIHAALSGSTSPNCTYAGVGTIIEDAVQMSAASARNAGLTFGFDYSVAPGGPCRVTFLVTVVQPGVRGPAGKFSAEFEEGGAVSASVKASRPAA